MLSLGESHSPGSFCCHCHTFVCFKPQRVNICRSHHIYWCTSRWWSTPPAWCSLAPVAKHCVSDMSAECRNLQTQSALARHGEWRPWELAQMNPRAQDSGTALIRNFHSIFSVWIAIVMTVKSLTYIWNQSFQKLKLQASLSILCISVWNFTHIINLLYSPNVSIWLLWLTYVTIRLISWVLLNAPQVRQPLFTAIVLQPQPMEFLYPVLMEPIKNGHLTLWWLLYFDHLILDIKVVVSALWVYADQRTHLQWIYSI